jgi:cbb3-type cytochrome oxidase subunit 3
VRRFPIQIELSKPGPSPADVLPNALAFVRFLNTISIILILVGGIWIFVNLNATAEVVFGVGAGLMLLSTFSLVVAVKIHNARLRSAEDRAAVLKALDDAD